MKDYCKSAVYLYMNGVPSKTQPVWIRWVIAALITLSSPMLAAEPTDLNIGPPLKGAWLNSSMPGQGFFVEVVTDPKVIFISWFTYPRPSEPLQSDPIKHRWYTIQGSYSGADTDVIIYETTGGSFLGVDTVLTDPIGTANIRFTGCNTAELEFQFDDSGENGVISIWRAVSINEAACDSLLPNPPVPETVEPNQISVFMNVNVLEMPSTTVKPNQMVIVENGVITRVSEFDPNLIPLDAVVIDGSSRYLMPGMVDTHTHLGTNVREFLGPNVLRSQVEQSANSQLVLYLARGVTTILNNGDFGEPLPRWASETETGVLVGPNIYSAQYARGDASTSDGGPPDRSVVNAEHARRFTQNAFAEGYQFMKIYNQTPRDAALAILDEAQSLGMPVVGHFPQTMGIKEALDNGLDMVAHSGAYLWTYFNNNTNTSNSTMNTAIAWSLDSKTAVTATLGIEEIIDQIWCNDPTGVAQYWSRDETRYMHPTTVSLNNRSINAKWRWNPDGCVRGAYVNVTNFLQKFTLKLHQAGVPLMMGTDSPTVLGVPGFSAIDETQSLVNSGISVADAIKIATWNGGDFISTQLQLAIPFGAVKAGWRADLVLLNSNPLEAVENLEDIVGVMANGRWKSSAWFDTELEAIAALYE